MSRAWVAALICGLLAAFAVAGCGGSDEDSLTKAEFIKQADAICAKGDAAREKVVQAAIKEEENGEQGPQGDAAGEEFVLDIALPPLAKMVEELGELGEPTTGGETANKIVTGFEEGVELIENEPLRVLEAKVDPWDEPKELGRDYGMKQCSEL